MCNHHRSSMDVSLGLRVPDSVKKDSIVHHSRNHLASTLISLAAASLLVFSAHSMAFNMKETSYDFLLAESSHVAIVAPRLSWYTKLLMDKPYSSNPVSIRIRLLYGEMRYSHTSSKHHSHHCPIIVPRT